MVGGENDVGPWVGLELVFDASTERLCSKGTSRAHLNVLLSLPYFISWQNLVCFGACRKLYA